MQLTHTYLKIRDNALCADEETSMFFSEYVQDILAAKRICSECPVMDLCLEQAIETEEPAGVWGGQLFKEGKILAYKKNRGKPSKKIANETFMEDVPIPEHLQEAVQEIIDWDAHPAIG